MSYHAVTCDIYVLTRARTYLKGLLAFGCRKAKAGKMHNSNRRRNGTCTRGILDCRRLETIHTRTRHTHTRTPWAVKTCLLCRPFLLIVDWFDRRLIKFKMQGLTLTCTLSSRFGGLEAPAPRMPRGPAEQCMGRMGQMHCIKPSMGWCMGRMKRMANIAVDLRGL